MDQALRVLVLTTLFPHRPGEKEGNFVLDQVRALAAKGVDVTVVVAKPWNPVPSLAPEIKRKIDERLYAGERFRVRNAAFFSLPRFALGQKAYDFARQGMLPAIDLLGDFDVVHAHGFLMGSVAVYFSQRANIPSIVTIHGIETRSHFDDTENKRQRITEVLERADRVVLVGSPLFEYCRKYTSHVENFTVVGNGCTLYPDLKPSSRIPRRKALRVVAVSNYEESKGFDLLVEAVANPELRDELELVLVGEGDGFRKLRTHAREKGFGNFIHFTGLLSHREALEEVLAGDIFCLPSWREAFGIMYAEAMALGKLTMGCSGQGPSDFIRHLETGYLMASGNTKAVMEGLRWALHHPEAAKEIATRGQEYAVTSLTWEANASRMMEVYENIIQRRKQRRVPGAAADDRTATA
jgi:glycosyltransferase involved in cell wall biosynthesis